MKTKSIVSVVLFLMGSAGIVSAQKINIKVNESDERIGGNKNPAMTVNIYDANPEDVTSKWKSHATCSTLEASRGGCRIKYVFWFSTLAGAHTVLPADLFLYNASYVKRDEACHTVSSVSTKRF